jgi:uncharacterized protein (UPF0332 family)
VSLAAELLEQAEMLVKREPKNPKQASLRRAVSAAYYALFHLLAEAAARQFAELCDRSDAETVSRVVRSFSHIDMKKVSEKFALSVLPTSLKRPNELYETPDELIKVANVFISLYQARMDADYDTGKLVTRPEALKRIEEAKKAFAEWEKVKATADVRTYLACFSLWETWNKQR